jgi:hypothetical protein
LKEGVSFLHGWQAGHNYDLSLQLYESAALACYTNADIELMQKYLGILFGNAKCFEDKLHGYLVMIQAMLNHDKHVEATEKILFILEGENIMYKLRFRDALFLAQIYSLPQSLAKFFQLKLPQRMCTWSLCQQKNSLIKSLQKMLYVGRG